MLKIYICENILSDSSRTYDVHIRDTGLESVVVLHANNQRAAFALVDDMLRAIDRHSTATLVEFVSA